MWAVRRGYRKGRMNTDPRVSGPDHTKETSPPVAPGGLCITPIEKEQ